MKLDEIDPLCIHLFDSFRTYLNRHKEISPEDRKSSLFEFYKLCQKDI